LEQWMSHAVEGTEGAEVWPPLAPKPGDRLVTKPTYSAFTASELEAVLDELRVDTLVLTGCATEVHLLTTAMDALQRGFAVELPADAQAGNSEAGERFALAVLGALVPYAPARKARLERLGAAA
ncbi:MAG: cysteine hydrolase family protein, partial [Polyangiaceae bacterium]